MNSITIAGNITRDIEIRPVGSDIMGAFGVADNQGKDKQPIYWNCQLWGKRASMDSLGQYLMKGQAVTVVGNVTEREFTDKDGNKRKTMDLRVQDVALQGGKRDEGQRSPAPQARPPAARPAQQDADFGDDMIPF